MEKGNPVRPRRKIRSARSAIVSPYFSKLVLFKHPVGLAFHNTSSTSTYCITERKPHRSIFFFASVSSAIYLNLIIH